MTLRCILHTPILQVCNYRYNNAHVSTFYANLHVLDGTYAVLKGLFGPNDVHHQYGIALTTPPFPNFNVTFPVETQMYLVKKSEPSCRSESVPFTFYPSKVEEKKPVIVAARQVKRDRNAMKEENVPQEQPSTGQIALPPKGFKSGGGSVIVEPKVEKEDEPFRLSDLICSAPTTEPSMNPPTHSYAEFATKHISLKDPQGNPVVIKSQIWDTAGQERYRALSTSYYRGAHGALLVFDITTEKEETFSNVQSWLRDLRQNSGTDTIVLLVGNKIDLDTDPSTPRADSPEFQDVGHRKVPTSEAQKLAESLRCKYVETSALSGVGVKEAFTGLIEDVFAFHDADDRGDRDVLDDVVTRTSSCC